MTHCTYCGKHMYDVFHTPRCRGHSNYDNSADLQAQIAEMNRQTLRDMEREEERRNQPYVPKPLWEEFAEIIAIILIGYLILKIIWYKLCLLLGL